MDETFITNFKTYSGYNWNGVNSSSFVTNNKVANAMSKLGFEIYDVDSNICKDYDVDEDGKNDFSIKHLTDGFKLETGDFLAKNGHVHFFSRN